MGHRRDLGWAGSSGRVLMEGGRGLMMDTCRMTVLPLPRSIVALSWESMLEMLNGARNSGKALAPMALLN